MRLSEDVMRHLPHEVERFVYDRAALATGIVHFGIGAFHRAHQAALTDNCLQTHDSRWGICGVSLRSPAVAEQLTPQDGLYTLIECGEGREHLRLIGSVREVLVAPRDNQAIIARLVSPECHIASFTVTEKGYAADASGRLDLGLAEFSFYPLLTRALAWRQAAGMPGLTLLSCDNLAGNGAALDALMRQYLAARAPALLGWFAQECACPSTMVDRIVPATTADQLARLESRLGLRDNGAVFAENFCQWVIEDRFAGPRPAWEVFGAQLVADVTPYETAKLRMLNGAHSLLAYRGLERGHEHVHQAIADPELRAAVLRLMLEEAAPSFAPAPGQDLAVYAARLIARFEDPALHHRLAQIAMDGSLKIPPRWLETLAFHQRHGRRCPAILGGLAAWLRHVRQPANDPLSPTLVELWESEGPGMAAALFGPGGLFAGQWQASAEELDLLK